MAQPSRGQSTGKPCLPCGNVDGTSAHILVPPELGIYGPSPPVMRMARKLQADGEIPAGEIVGLVRVREVPIVPGRSGALGPPTDPIKRSMRG